MPACAKRLELLADLPRTSTARLTLELAEGRYGSIEQQFVVLRNLRRNASGSWRPRKSMAILRGECRRVAAALLKAAQ